MDDLERLLNRPELEEPSPNLDDCIHRLLDEAERELTATPRKRPPVLRAVAAAAAMVLIGIVATSRLSPEPSAPQLTEPRVTTTRTIYVVQSNAEPQYPAKTAARTPQFWDGEVTTEIITQSGTTTIGTEQ